MKCALKALGYDPDSLIVDLIQMVRMVSNGEEVKMSKRTGNSITIRELCEDVGVDAARWFFVSKEAYRYTYALPRTGKVITVLKEDTRLTLSMFRLEHFTEAIAEKDRSLRIKPKGCITIDLTTETWQIDCILFCDNVSFFVYLNDTPRDILPFAVDKDHQFPAESQVAGKDGRKFLEEHDTEILVWLRDNTQYGYISPALMVRERSEEYLFDKAVT